MSKILIDHEAAKKVAIAGSSHGNATSHGVVCMAYLDMVAQRDYWRTIVQGGVGELPLENNAHAQGDNA
jgi:hypothetical protein